MTLRWQKRINPIGPGAWGLFEITSFMMTSRAVAFGVGVIGWNAAFWVVAFGRKVVYIRQRRHVNFAPMVAAIGNGRVA